jgi:phenylalanyl-tRNA synthetase beta chain
MPTIGVKKRVLEQELGKSYTEQELDKILFDYGLELDAIETTGIANESDYIYKIEVPANRYDLLCIEGLGRALRIFSGL